MRAVPVRLLLPVVLAAAAALLVLSGFAVAQTTKECEGVRQCVSISGPWVVIPARAEVTYLVDCPRRQGIVAGLDAISQSRNVNVSFDGRLGSPVGAGRTTTRYAVFRASTATSRRGLFRPFVGCIPTRSSPRATTSVRVLPGAPFEYAQTSISVKPGTVRKGTIGCAGKQRLVRTWHAIAFRTKRAPNVSAADAIRVTRARSGKQVAVRIATSSALPRGARAEVQLGVVCAR